ncbi:MAG: hypothetical protein GKR94_23875 [Gammaproteobacteria bacterium]|nr:hypothetical protein [Gammaproteobacteria bacterium]
MLDHAIGPVDGLFWILHSLVGVKQALRRKRKVMAVVAYVADGHQAVAFETVTMTAKAAAMADFHRGVAAGIPFAVAPFVMVLEELNRA